MTPKPLPQDQEEKPEGPADLSKGDYVQDRPLATRAGAKMGWRHRAPIEKAFEEGQLKWPGRAFAAQRLEAGLDYARATRKAQKKTRDSTQNLDRVMGEMHDDVSILESGRAGRWVASVDSHLSHNDRQIVRRVCGLEEKPSEVIPSVCGAGMSKSVAARFCEALDNLIDAMETVKREPGRFNLSREAS